MIRENPYNRLKRIVRQWIYDNVLYRKRVKSWSLDFMKNEYDLSELPEKIRTAHDLGYVIELSVDGDCVIFTYVKKLPTNLPYELR